MDPHQNRPLAPPVYGSPPPADGFAEYPNAAAPAPPGPPAGGGGSPISLGMLREYKWTALLIFVAVATGGLAGVWTLVEPKYRASATIEVHPTKQVVAFNTEDNGAVPFYQQFLYTQLRKLQSPKVIERVLSRPEIKQSRWLFGESQSLLARLLEPAAADARLLHALEIDNEAGSSLIEVSVNAPDPYEAAMVANAIVEEYLAAITEEKEAQDTELARRRRAQEEALRREIQQLEAKADRIRANLKVLTPEELVNSRRTRLDDLMARRDNIELELQNLRAMLAELEQYQSDAGAPTSAPVAFDQDPVWAEINEELQSARFELELADDNFGDAHPKILRLKKRIAFLERRLRQREQVLAHGTPGPATVSPGQGVLSLVMTPDALRWQIKQKENELQHLDQLIARRAAAFNATFTDADMLEATLREIAYKRELYETIKRKREASNIERFAPAAIEIEARAEPPDYPNHDPRKKLSLAVLFAAFAAGLGAAFGRGLLNQTVRDPDELAAGSAPFLGVLPLLRDPEKAKPVEATIQSECVRMVRTALLQRLGHRDHHVVQITSATPATGKTTFSIQLARSLAQCGKSVLLVDADMRNPTVARRLGLEVDYSGLIEAMLDPRAERKLIRPTSVGGMFILPAGRPASPVEVELLANGRLGACLKRWRETYDFVLLDSSPLLPVADARILARHADGTILLAREGHSRRQEVVESLAALTTAGGELLGTVLVGARRSSSYYAGSYYHHAEHHEPASARLERPREQ